MQHKDKPGKPRSQVAIHSFLNFKAGEYLGCTETQ